MVPMVAIRVLSHSKLVAAVAVQHPLDRPQHRAVVHQRVEAAALELHLHILAHLSLMQVVAVVVQITLVLVVQAAGVTVVHLRHQQAAMEQITVAQAAAAVAVVPLASGVTVAQVLSF
jgi:hypothetical protein